MAADNKDPSKFMKMTIAGFQAGFQVLVHNKTWLRVSLETLPSRLDLKVDESIRDENESSLMKYRFKIGLNLSRHEKSFFLGNKSYPRKKNYKKFLPNFFFSLHPFFFVPSVSDVVTDFPTASLSTETSTLTFTTATVSPTFARTTRTSVSSKSLRQSPSMMRSWGSDRLGQKNNA